MSGDFPLGHLPPLAYDQRQGMRVPAPVTSLLTNSSATKHQSRINMVSSRILVLIINSTPSPKPYSPSETLSLIILDYRLKSKYRKEKTMNWLVSQ